MAARLAVFFGPTTRQVSVSYVLRDLLITQEIAQDVTELVIAVKLIKHN